MRTLTQRIKQTNEGLERILKDKNVDKYVDVSINKPLDISIDNKTYRVKIDSAINAGVKTKSDFNIIKLNDDLSLEISYDTCKKIALDPFGEFKGVIDNKEVSFKISEPTNESINESGAGVDALASIGKDIGKIALMAAFSNPIVGVGLLACAGLAGGVMGAKKLKDLKNKNGGLLDSFKNWWNNGDSEKDKSKEDKSKEDKSKEDKSKEDKSKISVNTGFTDILAIISGSLEGEDSENFGLFLGLISNKDGEIDMDKFENTVGSDAVIGKLQEIKADKNAAKSIQDAVSSIKPENRESFKAFLKNANEYAVAHVEHEKIKNDIEQLSKGLDELSDTDKKDRNKRIDEEKEKLSKAAEKLESAKESMKKSYNSYHDGVKDNTSIQNAVEQISKQQTGNNNEPASGENNNQDPGKQEDNTNKEDDDEEDDADDDDENKGKHDDADDDNAKSTIDDEEIIVKDKDGNSKTVKRKVERMVGPQGGKKYRVHRNGKWGPWNYGVPKKPKNESLCNIKSNIKESRLKTLKELKG